MRDKLELIGKGHLEAVLSAIDVAKKADQAVESTRVEIRRISGGKREAVAAAAADPAWRPGGGGVAPNSEEDLAVLEARLGILEASADRAWLDLRMPWNGFMHEMPEVVAPIDRRLCAAADRLQAAAQGDLAVETTPDTTGACSQPGDNWIGGKTLPFQARQCIAHEFGLIRGFGARIDWDESGTIRDFFLRVGIKLTTFWAKLETAERVADQVEEATKALRSHLEGAVQDLGRLRD